MNARAAAEIFHPGDFLREELEARGWSQQELSDIIGRPPRLVSEIISGKRSITPETAIGLGDAFGTGGEFWMNLESQFQLSRVKVDSDVVGRKANLYGLFPVREMIKRGWIQATSNIEVLEQQFMEFFEVRSISDEPNFCFAAKKTAVFDKATNLQLAWLYRVKNLAVAQQIPKYSKKNLLAAVESLKGLLTEPEEVRKVPAILANAGVRLVLVETLPGAKIDGACFWLDDDKPVIGMSLQYDRIDNFWFVLRHEVEHVLQGHGKDSVVLDIDVGVEVRDLPQEEVVANMASAEFCVSQAQLENFCARVSPYFSEQKVLLFAQRMKVHPGLVVGQLQRKLKRYDFLRKHQVKIRSLLVPYADADGWGSFTDEKGIL